MSTITLEVFSGSAKVKGPIITITQTLYDIGYYYDRRSEGFIVNHKPARGPRQEIHVLPNVFARTLPDVHRRVSDGWAAGCTQVSDAQLTRLGFIVSLREGAKRNVRNNSNV